MPRAYAAALGAFAALLLVAPAASATVMTVNDGGDGSGGTVCTLRDAIIAADSHVPTGGCPGGTGDDTITLAVPAVTLTRAGAGEDAAGTGDLDVTGKLVIDGAPGGTTIDAAHLDRVLDVLAGADLTVQGVELTGGLAPAGANASGVSGGQGRFGQPGQDGGGVRNAGTLRLDDVTVADNATSTGGAGASVSGAAGASIGGDGGAGGSGGGIASSGSLTVTASTIASNTTGAGGAGGTGTGIAGSSGSPAGGEGGGARGGSGGDGAGIYSTGTTTITDSTISSNQAGAGGPGGSGHGGAGFTVTSGQAGGGGDAEGGYGGLGGEGGGVADTQGTLTIDGSLISGNAAGDSGPAGSAFAGNGGNGEVAGSGSGTGGGGGTAYGGSAIFGAGGGGLYAQFSIGSGTMTQLTATSDTLTQNTAGAAGSAGPGTGGAGGRAGTGAHGGDGGAGHGGPGDTGGAGGGAYREGTGGTFVAMSLVAATLYANQAGSATNGATGTGGLGGLGSTDGAAGASSTGANGTAGLGGGVSDALVSDSILSANTPDQCDPGSSTADSSPTNITFPDATCPGTAADPRLAPLADNGGPTETFRLLTGSPAIDSVPTVNAGCPASDQRGIARPQGSACDAGAYEHAPPAATTGDASAAATSATLTATVTPNLQATTVDFEWGPGADRGSSTTAQVVPAGRAGVAVSAPLTGLASATTYHYRVVATNGDGTTAGEDRTFTTGPAPAGPGPGPGPGPDTTGTGTGPTGTTTTTATKPPPPPPPVLTKLTLTPSAFRLPTKRVHAHRGTAISYIDSQAATVTFTVERKLAGIRKGKLCVAKPKRPKRGTHAAACTRYVAVKGSFSHADTAGSNALTWPGTLAGKALVPGSYRLSARPVAGGASGAVVTHGFTIER